MKYFMLLPMLLACGDKEEEADSASPDTGRGSRGRGARKPRHIFRI